MRIAPLDLRQQRFRTTMRGFDQTEVVAFQEYDFTASAG